MTTTLVFVNRASVDWITIAPPIIRPLYLANKRQLMRQLRDRSQFIDHIALLKTILKGNFDIVRVVVVECHNLSNTAVGAIMNQHLN